MLGYDPEMFKYFCHGILINSTLRELDLGHNYIGQNPEDLINLTDAIAQNSSLKILNLSFNMLGSDPEMFKYFCHGILINSTLNELDLGLNDLGKNPENLKNLELLIFNSSIKKFNLDDDNFPLDKLLEMRKSNKEIIF